MAIRHRAGAPAALHPFLPFSICCYFCSFLVLSGIGHTGSMAVMTLRGMPWYAVFTLWRQLNFLINATSFPLHRDIGTSRHWNPKCTWAERAPTREPGKGTDPRNSIFQVPLGSHRRSHRCAFHCQAAHGGYDVLGRCTLVAGTVFGLSFPETLLKPRGGTGVNNAPKRKLMPSKHR